VVATSQSVVRARTSGFFELFLAQPCRRGEWLRATILSRLIVLVAPIAVLLLAALAFALGGAPDEALASMALRSLVVCMALAWSFVGLGFLISATARSPERATVLALVVWVLVSMMHDFALIGALLRWRVAPELVFALAASNPVEAARIAILSSVDPELSVLGPVGFWLANTLGPRIALAVGVGWPLVLGALAILGAHRRLARMDLVG
jgi:ABC-2 type transport system permease protein